MKRKNRQEIKKGTWKKKKKSTSKLSKIKCFFELNKELETEMFKTRAKSEKIQEIDHGFQRRCADGHKMNHINP